MAAQRKSLPSPPADEAGQCPDLSGSPWCQDAWDTIDGGGGDGDLVNYGDRPRSHGGVIVRAGDPSLFNDGQNGTEDALIGIERVVGTNQIDTIEALPGGRPDSFVQGLSGNDKITGSPGADLLAGGGLDDRIVARESRSSQFSVKDGVSCGDEFDIAILDLRDDLIDGSCETVERAAIDEGGILSILNRGLRLRRGRVAVRLHCPRSSKTRCNGRLTISRPARRLGSARYRIGKGRRKTVGVQVPAGATGRVLVRAVEPDSQGRPKTSEKRLRLR